MRHVIGSVADFPERRAVPVRVSGREIVVVRFNERLFAVRNTCPHQSQSFTPAAVVRGALETTGRVGEIELGEEQPVIVCPWHTWEFRLRDGHCARDASKRVKTYRVDVEGDDVVLEI
jgi:nitrite reductase/ring-hydroxylating ferredoxin subunit